MRDNKLSFPAFNVLRACNEVKYLEHHLTDEKLKWKFGLCSSSENCPPVAAVQISSMQRLKVVYNDGLRMLLNVPRGTGL